MASFFALDVCNFRVHFGQFIPFRRVEQLLWFQRSWLVQSEGQKIVGLKFTFNLERFFGERNPQFVKAMKTAECISSALTYFALKKGLLWFFCDVPKKFSFICLLQLGTGVEEGKCLFLRIAREAKFSQFQGVANDAVKKNGVVFEKFPFIR